MRANCGLEFASSAIGDVIGPVDTLVVAGGSGMDQAVADSELIDRIGVWRRTRAGSPRSAPAPSCSRPPACSRAGGRPPTGPTAVAGGRLRRGHRGSRRHLRPGRQRLDLRRRDRRDRPGPRARGRRPRTPGRGHRRASAGRLPTALRGRAQYSTLLAGQAADTEPVRDLLSWLRDHLTEDLSLPALARQVNLSERQFTRVFKAQVGVTAADHVEAVRLESACRLLETTDSTIEQIARTCGFGTPETMNRTFRRRLNATPAITATTSAATSPSHRHPEAVLAGRFWYGWRPVYGEIGSTSGPPRETGGLSISGPAVAPSFLNPRRPRSTMPAKRSTTGA